MRSGTLSDTEAVLSLFRAARPPLSPDHLHRCITTVPWVVAHAADGNLVGFAYGVEFAPDIVELSNLYVHPEFRDKSTGGALLDWFESEASLAGYVGVILTNSQYYSSPEKRDASLFYERHGYAPVITTGPTIVWFKAIQVTQSAG